MTDALTRAARAIHEKHTWLSRSEANDAAREIARAALAKAAPEQSEE